MKRQVELAGYFLPPSQGSAPFYSVPRVPPFRLHPRLCSGRRFAATVLRNFAGGVAQRVNVKPNPSEGGTQ